MKDIIKRIIGVLVLLIGGLALFSIANLSLKTSKHFRYEDRDGNIGYSNKCYTNKDELICEVENGTIFVNQFYWEGK